MLDRVMERLFLRPRKPLIAFTAVPGGAGTDLLDCMLHEPEFDLSTESALSSAASVPDPALSAILSQCLDRWGCPFTCTAVSSMAAVVKAFMLHGHGLYFAPLPCSLFIRAQQGNRRGTASSAQQIDCMMAEGK